MSYIGNTATQQAFTPAVDFFNGNGSTTAFTLSRPVASVAQVQAVVENVPQKPNDAFTVSGNTITFTSAPPSGTQNIYVYYTSPITQVIAPGQGTVGPTALTAGSPSWSQAGGVTLPRIDSTNEGGQLNFNRASDDTAVWSIDSFGGTSTPTLRFINSATVAMALDGSNNVGIGTSSPTSSLVVSGAASGTPTVNGVHLGVQGSYATIELCNTTGAFIDFTSSGTDNKGRILYDNTNNFMSLATNGNERARIDSSGNLLVGTTSVVQNGKQTIAANLATSTGFVVQNTNTPQNYFAIFANSSAAIAGSISHSGSTTVAFNTSSDYRLKKDIQPMQNALDKVSALKPCTYKWIEDDTEGEGFIAHELQEVCPHAVTGAKDAVDADGNIIPQGIDTSFLVATLTAAIKEQQAIIEQLTQRITALEAK